MPPARAKVCAGGAVSVTSRASIAGYHTEKSEPRQGFFVYLLSVRRLLLTWSRVLCMYRDMTNTTTTTKHTHPVVFGRRVADCPRCAELNAGAAPVRWAGSRNAQFEAQRIAAIAAHDCTRSKCGPVCTAFDW